MVLNPWNALAEVSKPLLGPFNSCKYFYIFIISSRRFKSWCSEEVLTTFPELPTFHMRLSLPSWEPHSSSYITQFDGRQCLTPKLSALNYRILQCKKHINSYIPIIFPCSLSSLSSETSIFYFLKSDLMLENKTLLSNI